MKTKIINILSWTGLGFLEPLVRLINGEEPRKNTIDLFKKVFVPILSIFLFLGIWSSGASYLFNVEVERKVSKALKDQGKEAAEEMKRCIASGEAICKPNTLPSPTDVWSAAILLWEDHKSISADKKEFKKKTAKINAQREAKGLDDIAYTGRPSFVDQIMTSLKTILFGVLLAIFIAVPIGIVLGLSETLRTALNWFIQIFKPVSPVVWLLLVSMIVKTVATDTTVDKSFLISFISVGLCAMWATLVNTSMGVSSVDKDYLNVAKVLRLGVFSNVFKIVLPASIPLIFTGIRITVSVAWMVLIAIELLAQSPGLGTFVWEEFQNGSGESNAKIIVALFVIGIIGFALERIMLTVQKLVSFEDRLA